MFVALVIGNNKSIPFLYTCKILVHQHGETDQRLRKLGCYRSSRHSLKNRLGQKTYHWLQSMLQRTRPMRQEVLRVQVFVLLREITKPLVHF